MANWGAAGGGLVTGAEAGANFGPWGAAIGGVAGGLLGLLTPEQQLMKKMTNPYQGQIDAGINKLMESHTGAQMAQNASAGYRRDARAQFDALQGNPAMAGNANVMSALYNKAQSTAAEAITNANVQGANVDQQAHARGLSMEMQNAGQNQQMQSYNNQVDVANQRPGFFQQILQQSIGTLAGSGVAKMTGGGGADGAPNPMTQDRGGWGGTGQSMPSSPAIPSGLQPNMGAARQSLRQSITPQLGMFDPLGGGGGGASGSGQPSWP